MGAFYLILNLDNGEYLDPGQLGYERKFCFTALSYVAPALVGLLVVDGPRIKGDGWAGYRIIVVGDDTSNSFSRIYLHA